MFSVLKFKFVVILFIIVVLQKVFLLMKNNKYTPGWERFIRNWGETKKKKKSTHQSRSPHCSVCVCTCVCALLLSLGIRVCVSARRELGGHWIWRGDVSCGAEMETNGESCCRQDAPIQTRTLSWWGRFKIKARPGRQGSETEILFSVKTKARSRPDQNQTRSSDEGGLEFKTKDSRSEEQKKSVRSQCVIKKWTRSGY